MDLPIPIRPGDQLRLLPKAILKGITLLLDGVSHREEENEGKGDGINRTFSKWSDMHVR